MKRLTSVSIFLFVAGACVVGNQIMETEESMFEWATALNVHLATSFANEFPHELDEIKPAVRAILSANDGWGAPFRYRPGYWLSTLSRCWRARFEARTCPPCAS